MPKPKETEWDLELPDEQLETNGEVELSEEDAAERDQRNEALRKAEEQANFKRRTQVMQRGLPRPSTVDIRALLGEVLKISDPVEKAIAQETALLIANDALKYPLQGSKVNGSPRPLEAFDDNALEMARAEIAQEMPVDAAGEIHNLEESWSSSHEASSSLPGLSNYRDEGTDEHQIITEAINVRTPHHLMKCLELMTGRISKIPSWLTRKGATSLRKR